MEVKLMYIYDLHCDTVSRCLDLNQNLFENDGQLDIKRGLNYKKRVQVFALFVDSLYKGQPAFERFSDQLSFFNKQLELNKDSIQLLTGHKKPQDNICNAVLAIEGGHALNGQIENVQYIYDAGVRILTLVWNNDNELGSGVKGDPSRGITQFGKQVILKNEELGIINDISHLNDTGIYDVFSLSNKPIIASHSNLRSTANHKRNLTDEQFKELIKINGLCGINFYPPFLSPDPDNSTIDDLHNMLDSMLSLGGENIICLGSDFDGADMPPFITGFETLYSLYSNVVKWYGEKIADKIFYKNADNFFEKNLYN